ncbi:MAG TPA: hypothetical protein PK413_21210 [Thermoanaerobaculia bacterium]|nr:hypothetical protein [Thermoanaerobaculia bacterium]
MLTDFQAGLLLGILIGEGHFGGDGKQAQISVRMHTDHESLFRWLEEVVPGSKLYGPYHHGGRSYFQWMVRGSALATLLPVLDRILGPELDARAHRRYLEMKEKYRL